MTTPRYKHGTLIWQGRPLLEVESQDVTLTSRDIVKLTGGRRGTLPVKNRAQEAKVSFKTQCARTGPEADYMGSLRSGSDVTVLLDDPMLGGTYDLRITEISGTDEANGDKSYNVSTEGIKAS
jgi:hypothetical protein